MASSLISALTNLRKSKTYFEDFLRQVKTGIGEPIFKRYIQKIDWIIQDFKTTIHFPEDVRQSIVREMSSDEFQADAIYDKFLLLSPDNRKILEDTTDAMLANDIIKIVNYKEDIIDAFNSGMKYLLRDKSVIINLEKNLEESNPALDYYNEKFNNYK